MKRNLIAAVAAGVIVGGGGTAALAAALSGCSSGSPSASQSSAPSGGQSAGQGGGQDGSEKPPMCVTVPISENSGNGPVLWTKWCGTGSSGAAPMKAGTGQLIVDGSSLDPAQCTQANPCVIVWPRSPKS
jgi:hypothetical protein